MLRFSIFIASVLVIFLLGGAFLFQKIEAQTANPLSASVTNDLQFLIDQKSNELQVLQVEREKTEKTLQEISGTSNTLNREIKIIDNSISQLNLSTRANKISLEKLGLEINSLGSDITNIDEEINGSKETINKLFVEIQQKDRENLFIMFLRNISLSESIDEAQSLVTLNIALSENISNLRELQDSLGEKLETQKQKKYSSEVEKITLVNRQSIIQDQKSEKQRLLTQTKDQEKIYQQELQSLIKRQLAISDEVEKIESELRKKIDPNLLPIPRPGVLVIPVLGSLSQGYGATKFAMNGYRGHFHNGIDIAASIGTPIFSAEAGTVVATGDQDKYCKSGAYGKFVVVKHTNNLTTLYGHLSKILVKKGDKIETSGLLGYVGRTGYATGPHLHFTVYAGPTFYIGTSNTCGLMPYGGDLNPLKYINI